MLLNKFLPRIEFDSYEDFKANYKVNVPEDFNFGFDVVDVLAETDKNKKALVWCDDHGEEKTFTFGDISRLSSKTANYLKSLGIRKGDVVMLILRRRWEYWICVNALHKIGAIANPCTLQLTKKDIIYRGNSEKVKAVICVNDDFVINQVEAAEKEMPSLENKIVVGQPRDGWRFLEDEIEEFSDKFPRPTGEEATTYTDTMLIYFTSGTTGMPKMIQHNFAYPLGHIITAKYAQQVQENKLHMSVSDSGWVKFSWGKIYGQWICGAVVFAYDMDKFVPSRLLEVISKYKITTFCAPPTMYRFMLQEDLTKYDLSSIKHYCTGGEPMNPDVIRKWQEYTGLIPYEMFGQTEGCLLFADFPWFEPRMGSMGKPSPVYDIHLVDKDGNEVKAGEEGSIVIMNAKEHPLGLFTGYYHNPEMTEEKLLGRYYNTDDMASIDEDGYYYYIGRDDDVIKCSGYRIGPFEVESAVLEHPSVVECAITAAPDPIRGRVVKATVVLAANYQPSDELKKEIQNHVKKVTAPYKYPRIIEFVDELPKTVSGKIRRNEIRKSDHVKATK